MFLCSCVYRGRLYVYLVRESRMRNRLRGGGRRMHRFRASHMGAFRVCEALRGASEAVTVYQHQRSRTTAP